MVLKLCIILSIISISIKAHPSRLKILPGLAFYRTDEGHDVSNEKMLDKDKELLKSMWNIVDKMDDKTEEDSSLYRSVPYSVPLSSDNNMHIDHARINSGGLMNLTPYPTSNSHSTKSATMKGMVHPAKMPGMGTPITTINVFSAYPAVSPKHESRYPTSYHHVSPQYANTYGTSPYSNTDITHKSRYPTTLAQNPNYDKPQMYEAMLPNNPTGYEQRNHHQMHDNILTHPQYDSKMGSPYDSAMNNHDEHNMYDPATHSDNLGQYGGIENPEQASPQHFLVPQMMSDMSMGHMGSMGSMGPIGPMGSMRDMNMN